MRLGLELGLGVVGGMGWWMGGRELHMASRREERLGNARGCDEWMGWEGSMGICKPPTPYSLQSRGAYKIIGGAW